MNILYVLNSSKMGGMERHVLELVEGMLLDGENVYVWCPQGEMSKIYREKGAKVTVKAIGTDLDTKYIRELKNFLVINKIDVVHAHELKAVVNALVAGYFAKTKVRISHTHTPISNWKINPLKRFLDVLVYSTLVNMFSSKEVALTETVAKTKIREGINKNKISVIPNALDTGYLTVTPVERSKYRGEIRDKFLISKGAIVFGCVGRLTQEKGHAILIRAFKSFIESEVFHKHDFFLLIAGAGPLEKSLRELSRELGIESSVIFTGPFGDAEKVKIYSSIDVFCFPSYAEGFGIVLLEAMYMGLPIIASDLEVLREIGKGAIEYFQPGSFSELSSRMSFIYKKILSGEIVLSENNVRSVENEYTMSKFIKSYKDLYRSLQ